MAQSVTGAAPRKPQTVSVSKEVSQEAKMQSKRRGVRVNSRVPVTVAWQSGVGAKELKVHTRIVGPYGCLAVIPQDFPVEQHLELINSANERMNPAVWLSERQTACGRLGVRNRADRAGDGFLGT